MRLWRITRSTGSIGRGTAAPRVTCLSWELALGLVSPARHPVIVRYSDQRRQRAEHFTDDVRGADLNSEMLGRLLETEGAVSEH